LIEKLNTRDKKNNESSKSSFLLTIRISSINIHETAMITKISAGWINGWSELIGSKWNNRT